MTDPTDMQTLAVMAASIYGARVFANTPLTAEERVKRYDAAVDEAMELLGYIKARVGYPPREVTKKNFEDILGPQHRALRNNKLKDGE